MSLVVLLCKWTFDAGSALERSEWIALIKGIASPAEEYAETVIDEDMEEEEASVAVDPLYHRALYCSSESRGKECRTAV